MAGICDLFKAFDQDGNGQLDFREMFIGLALLLSTSREQRLECAFKMMDSNDSGNISRTEVQWFLRDIAPRSVSAREVVDLADRVMREVDTNRSGLITYSEFMRWPGKDAVLNWLDAYHDRVLALYGGSAAASAPAGS